MRNPDRELDGTNTEDFPTGEAGIRFIDRGSMPVTGAQFGPPPRRIANVRRTADALRAFLRFLGLLALAMGLLLGLLLAADRLLPSTTRPTTTTSEGPG